MKEHFLELLALEDVKGVMVLDSTGRLAFQEFNESPASPIGADDVQALIGAIAGIRELEVVYENCRLFIRKYTGGTLIVVAGRFALVAMVRLNCDIVIPTLSETSDKPKGLGRFFKR